MAPLPPTVSTGGKRNARGNPGVRRESGRELVEGVGCGGGVRGCGGEGCRGRGGGGGWRV